MSDIKYTSDQQAVIDIRGKNVLVSAAAGSGKTAVLTARIVDLICDKDNPRSIEDMLIVTFTDAAAAEMRDRIGEAIRKKAAEFPDDPHLARQQTLVHSALITTVHSFCLYLIRNHFERIGLDPSFSVASTETAELLLEDALEEAMGQMMSEEPERFDLVQERFMEAFSDEDLRSILKKLLEVVKSQPFAEDYFDTMEARLKAFAEDPEHSAAVDFMTEYEGRLLRDYASDVDDQMDYMEQNGFHAYVDALQDDKAFFLQLAGMTSLDDRHNAISAHTFARLGSVKDKSDAEKKSMQARREKYVKKRVKDLQKKFHRMPLSEMLEYDLKNEPVLSALLELLKRFYRCYQEKKKEKNVIDFSDMEHFALEILYDREGEERVPSEVAKAYRDHFCEVMVDEYQDSNYIQEYLLSAVSKITENGGDRFMVGDVKQSIYRFRLARPEIFREKYDTYSDDKNERDVRINLSKNFRSRREVLDSVNCVFEDSMFRAVGDIDYNDKAKLYLGAEFYPAKETDENISEILICPTQSFENSELKNRNEWEALVTGLRIRELIESGFPVTDKKKDENGNTVFYLRPIRYSDITILVRAVKNRASYIKRVLEAMSIPTMVLSREGYFETPEIRVLMNYVSVLDNPLQDIPLLGILHSPFGGFTEDEIATMRVGQTGDYLFYSLLYYKEKGEDEALKEKVAAFLEKLDYYRKLSKKKNVYDILKLLMEKEGIKEYYAASRFGEQRVANLKILLKRAKSYGEDGGANLSNFVRYVDSMKSRNLDYGEANISDEKANVVRIFTMHKSKGLEFPVCFVLGMGNALKNTKAENEKQIIMDPLFGIGMDYADPKERIIHPSFLLTALKLRDSIEERGEDLRLLYVAMTRAKEKLILVGKFKGDSEEAFEEYGERRPFRVNEIMDMDSYFDVLLKEGVWNPECFRLLTCSLPESEKEKDTFEVRRALWKEALLNTPAGEPFRDFVYPHESLQNVFTKTSVSDLKNQAFEEEEEAVNAPFLEALSEEENGKEALKRGFPTPCVPEFLKKKKDTLAGARYGDAHHRVMELIHFTEFENRSESEWESILQAQRKALVEEYFLKAEDDKLVKDETVLHFLKTGLAARMLAAEKADSLRREQPFVLSLPANEVNPSFPADEKVLVQGVIDAYFEEEDGIVLLDYKTESKVTEEDLKERFYVQLKYYAKALEKLEKKKVKEVLIYSFFLGKVVSLEL